MATPLTMVAAAVAVVFGALSGEASALSLGRISVQSALGEPLRAEVAVAEISAAEVEGLRVNVASSDAFRIAGIPYNAALPDVRASLQRRADGRYVIRLTSTRSLTDPFVDLLLEASSGTSRVMRDYTLLLDPPVNRPAPAAVTPTPAQTPPTAQMPAQVPAPVQAQSAPVARPATPPTQAVEANANANANATPPQQLAVRAGDTASKIASAYKPAEVSLDQMLVAMLRANPEAFIGGNVNRIRAGALIELPAASLAGEIPAAEARRTVVAQSRDFGEYRRRLADNAPASRVARSGREASGKLQASVEDRGAASASSDRLTIAQGRLADEQLARTRQAQDSSARMAELSKNIGELNTLQAAGTGATANPAGASGTSLAAEAATVAAGTTATTGAADATSATATAASPSLAPTAATVVTASPPPAQPPAPSSPVPDAPPWYVDFLNSPVFLGALSLVVLLLGWVAYRLASKRREKAVESVFLDSRLPKDSFFAGSGGESVDTQNRGNSIVSSLTYSPSQMDSSDVDPVAEADVYLAYGRDLQAEEILREALRVNPERVAIHLKLLEIHAKRRDLRAYETLAADVQKLTGGTGNDWNRVMEMGRELDPRNPLYENGLRSPTFARAAAVPPAGAVAAAAVGFSHSLDSALPPPPSVAGAYAAPPPAFVPSVTPLDFDLDLDRPDAQAALDSEWISASQPTRSASETNHAPAGPDDGYLETMRDEPRVLPPAPIDLENDFNTEPGALEMPMLRPQEEPTVPYDPSAVRGDLKSDSGFIEFDMSAFTGLPSSDSADTEAGALDAFNDPSESPHAIKLSLARELESLGDTEGARSLMEEVEAESTGELKAQARQLLARLE